MEITRTQFSATKLLCLIAIIGSSNSETTLSICPYPKKGFPCTLTCLSPKTLNVLFLKTNGSLSGEGGCLMSTGCKSRNQRYKVSQDSNGTYFRITQLNKIEDEGDWHCEHGEDKSMFKKLTVYTIISNLQIKEVPKKVNKDFTLTAEGYCVYPNITNATLEPSLSHHIPKIDYVSYQEKCGKYEYKVKISFMINHSNVTGDVKFRVKVQQNGVNTSFVSNYSTPVYFQALECIGPVICKPGFSFILLLLSLFSSFGIFWFFGIHKKTVSRNWKHQKCKILGILGAGAIACLVLTSVLAFSLSSDCLCSSCTCVINSIMLGLVGLVEVVLTIVILLCCIIRNQDKKSTDTEFQDSLMNINQLVSFGVEDASPSLNQEDYQDSSTEKTASNSLIDQLQQVSSGEENASPHLNQEENQDSSTEENASNSLIDPLQQVSSGDENASPHLNQEDNQDSSTEENASNSLIDQLQQVSSGEENASPHLNQEENQDSSTEENASNSLIDHHNQDSSTEENASNSLIDKHNQGSSNKDSDIYFDATEDNQGSSNKVSDIFFDAEEGNQGSGSKDALSCQSIESG